jgi:hypothetical protein
MPCVSERSRAPFVVATMTGSLPMGGVVADTPIYALACTPPQLRLAAVASLHPVMQTVPLEGVFALTISNVITPDEADAIVALTEHMGYRDEAPGIRTAPGMRMNQSVHWLATAEMLAGLFARIGHLLPHAIDGDALYPMFSHRLNMYKYEQGDVFNRHTDGDWPGYALSEAGDAMVEWAGLRSKLTMLLYLNGPEDGVQGGTTRLYAPDGRFLDVTPKKGAALFFRHGFGADSVLHAGMRVTGETAKYVARINVMYTSR